MMRLCSRRAHVIWCDFRRMVWDIRFGGPPGDDEGTAASKRIMNVHPPFAFVEVTEPQRYRDVAIMGFWIAHVAVCSMRFGECKHEVEMEEIDRLSARAKLVPASEWEKPEEEPDFVEDFGAWLQRQVDGLEDDKHVRRPGYEDTSGGND